ncbi:Capsule polysaccharide biosynthesis protein [Xylanibacter ruminicola]|uniref:Capsule polysaccharide biosynthesis protein n=1 Tax=Xylanibacter ruminicola TaxID=839 RepID=A0A1H5SGA8_XYLRU|nr:hypothetical protein [Xylanibacter ruminicola]SEF49646.1 Capsule polysaccharide biosynthesis protein [Xylanibacter ruminicola]
MKKFYYSSCSLEAPHAGIILDDILTSKKEGDTVYLGYCHCALSACFMNLSGHRSICKFCHYMYDQYKKKYGDGVNMMPIHYEDMAHQDRSLVFGESESIRVFKYRGVEIGSSVLSMYYDITRDLDMANWEGFIRWALPLINNLCDFVDYVYQLLTELKPDQVLIYNGRLFENRLFYDIAKVMGIKFVSLEGVGGHIEPYKKIRFVGEWPLNIELYGRMVEDLWKNSPESLEEKTRKASTFYEKRRNGILVFDTRVYTKDQQKDLLPEGFDVSLTNIAIYNSSQDEIAALGDEWQKGNLFTSQYEAIEFMLEHAKPSIHFYLRIHPNLKGVTHKAHTDLYNLSKHPNITIIPPDSKVSSYALMDACDKVITFGSSTGVEASYWGKPSILVGRSFYEMTGACYHMKNRDELVSAINTDLPAKERLGALKYAYFVLDRKYSVDESNIDIDVRYRHMRWDFFSTSYFKIHHSDWLFQLYYFYYCILGTKFNNGLLNFPWPKR